MGEFTLMNVCPLYSFGESEKWCENQKPGRTWTEMVFVKVFIAPLTAHVNCL